MEIGSEIKKDSYSVKFEARENGQVLGWVYLYIIAQERHEEPYGFLENVYVEQEYRSRGIGSKLIEAAIAKAREIGCYKIIGNSRCVNERAHAFYERFGMKKFGFEFRLDLKESKPKQKD